MYLYLIYAVKTMQLYFTFDYSVSVFEHLEKKLKHCLICIFVLFIYLCYLHDFMQDTIATCTVALQTPATSLPWSYQ